MALARGSRLGAYEVGALIGAGGMGEVYRARDTTLKRDVALKILPDAFASDPERLARFTREAHVLAPLNHPHVAAIYGFENSGAVHALVLELVEGPTLADRIVTGMPPLDETLRIAQQIAEALEAAHEKGIVHRDLRPANIKIIYLDRDRIWSVRLDTSSGEFRPSPPEMLFTVLSLEGGRRVNGIAQLAVSRDGSRIYYQQPVEQPDSDVIHVRTGWGGARQ